MNITIICVTRITFPYFKDEEMHRPFALSVYNFAEFSKMYPGKSTTYENSLLVGKDNHIHI